ncbi:hypothetical protein QR680_009774 [Steinernema hermaphroditum]|uniref:tRNA/rRNA methyltransferase SpoU type domain-containing protein n=1 Tax=Steinernema hermaphroditum TaxID=289476 RepID=A0AA39IP45_9BILA|nr:hypothetical protein QR680_009774 [Steinernema hermaphroditum]
MISQLVRQTVLLGKSASIVTSARSFSLSALRGARYGSRFGQQTFAAPRTGGALREKLFGPATSKPFLYGTYALGGASLAGIGMLCWYGLGMSKDISIVNKAALWPQEVRDRLKSTYAYLAGSVLMTGGFGYLAARSPVLFRMSASGGFMATLGWCAAMIAAGMACRSIPYDSTALKHLAWAAHCGVLGACFASLAVVGGPVLMRAAWYTAAITAGLSTTAACAPSEKFLYMGGALSMGFAVMFAACLGSFLLPPNSMAAAGVASFVMYGGLILFGGFLLYDTQKVVRMAERHSDYRYSYDGSVMKSSFDPINAAMEGLQLGHLYDADLGGRSADSKPSKDRMLWEEEAESWIERFRSSPDAVAAFLEETQREGNAERLGQMLPLLAEKVDAPKQIRTACHRLLNDVSSRVARKAAGEAIALLAMKASDEATRLRWQKFAVLLNMLEEPQFHLVKPVLAVFDWLIEQCVQMAKVADSSEDPNVFGWYYGQIAFEKAIKHTNGWIRVWAVQKAANLPAVLFQKDTKFVFEQLLPALNGIDNFWRMIEKSELERFLSDFNSFVQNVVDNMHPDGKALFYRSLLHSLTDSWSPIPLYFISSVLSKLGHLAVFEEEDFPKIRSAVSGALKIQQLPLKYETVANLIRMFLKTTRWTDDSVWFLPELLSSLDYRIASDLLSNDIGEATSSLGKTSLDNVVKIGLKLLHIGEASRILSFGVVARALLDEKEDLKKKATEMFASGDEMFVALALLGDLDESTSVAFMASYVESCRTNPVHRNLFDPIVRPILGYSKDVVATLISVLDRPEPLDSGFECFINNSFYVTASFLDEAEQDELLGQRRCYILQRVTKSLSAAVSPESRSLFFSHLRLYDLLATTETPEADAAGLCKLCVDETDRTRDWDSIRVLFSVIGRTINMQVPDIDEQVDILFTLEGVVSEFQKSIHYLPAIGAYFGVLFKSEARNSEKAVSTFLKFMEGASLNTSIAGLLAELVEKHYATLSPDWVRPVVELAKFGPIPRHDMKTISAAFEMAFANSSIAKHYSSALDRHLNLCMCRMIGISVAQRMCKEMGVEFQKRFLDESLSCAEEIDKSQSRSFGLSMPHRVKTRVSQLLILLEVFLPEETNDQFYEFLFNCLLDSCQQYSITLIAEWMLVKMFVDNDAIYKKFLNSVGVMAKKRTGSVASWLNVVMHVTRVRATEKDVGLFFATVFPWCSAQNFTIRCTAIAALKVVYEQFRSQKWCKNFAFIESLVNFDSEPAGNSKRIVGDLTSDFYFAHFNPVRDYCLQAVLETVPEKTGMPEDELIEPQVIRLGGRLSLTRPLHQEDTAMSDATSIVYSALAKSSCSAPDMHSDKELSEEFVDRDLLSMQRKINVKNGRKIEKTDGKKSLIVVATLIDKCANLGGLARTSEIFGVDKMVVANEAVTQSQDFKALSMSAENWLCIESVNKLDLESYLLRLREAGYKIVAAEQTNDSVPLEVYSFPEKACILLGDEKEGVPTKLLRLVDQTVEISQIGKTRSLNVHVSASLFIHTYAQQHLIE